MLSNHEHSLISPRIKFCSHVFVEAPNKHHASVTNKSSHVASHPILPDPPVPTSWESKLVATLLHPNLDICEAIQPGIPYRCIQVMNLGMWIWQHSLGSFLVLHGQLRLRFHGSSSSGSYSFDKKPWYFTPGCENPTCMTSGCGLRFAPVQVSLVDGRHVSWWSLTG